MSIQNMRLENNYDIQSMINETDDLIIEEVNDLETFESLKESWNILLQQCPDNDIFLTWEWLFLWWKHHGGDDKLRILLIKEKGELIGIAPFMQSAYRIGFVSVNVMENLCAIECDHSGIIYSHDCYKPAVALLNYLIGLIRDEKVIVRMSQIPENSHFAIVLRGLYEEFADSIFFQERTISTCPFITLPETLEELLSYLPRIRRSQLRRKLKSLQKDHNIELTEYDGDDDLGTQLKILFELHEKRWNEKIGASKFTKQETREFYFDVSEAFYQKGWLAFSFLNVDGKPASVIWGFKYNNAWLDMTPAFDQQYSRYSVGILHVMKVIEKAIGEGLNKFDFLKGNDSHKYRWPSNSIDNIQVTMAKSNSWATFRLMLLEIIIKLQNMKERSLRANLSLSFGKIKALLLRFKSNSLKEGD